MLKVKPVTSGLSNSNPQATVYIIQKGGESLPFFVQ